MKTVELPSAVGELVRSRSTSHSYPVVIASLLASGVATFGLASLVDDALRGWLAPVGAAQVIGAVLLALHAGLRRPELLRSEQHVERMRVLQMLADSDLPPEAAERMLSSPQVRTKSKGA